MAISINTNVSSLLAQQYLSTNQSKLSTTLMRLSSGKRVNEAKDDPAGLAISESMQAAIKGLKQGARNGNDGISLAQTAQGAMNQTLAILSRMREIAGQAANDTIDSGNLANANLEYQALLTEIDRIKATSKFNGVDLLAGGTVDIQIGENNSANDRLTITLTATDTTTLTVNGTDVTTKANAQSALDKVKVGIDAVTAGLAKLGASTSNLDSAVATNNARAVNLETARGRIVDADVAEESANLAKLMVMNQANVAMLAQANSAPQVVLKLLG